MNKTEKIQKIESALEQIRPYLETDGGNVRVVDITDEGIVQVELLGSCGSCPMSVSTFKAGIEETILKAVEDIAGVEALNLTAIA